MTLMREGCAHAHKQFNFKADKLETPVTVSQMGTNLLVDVSAGNRK